MTKECPNPLDPVMLVDDEVAWLRSLSILLERSLGIDNVIALQDGNEALNVLETMRASLILLDITMPNMTGEQLLAKITERFPETPVIILTGRNEVEIAVRCMKAGAFDYFVKTVETERLLSGIRRAMAISELKKENQRLKRGLIRQQLQNPEAFAEMVTGNAEMQAIFMYVEAIAASREPVLITGESGVGKDLIARAIHRLCAPDGPWQAVNVAGLDDNVFSDTLFGHVKGAFTGADQTRSGLIEQASGGVLFLDEIGDLSLSSQVKLLRLLQDGDYFPLGSDRPRKMNVRVVAATNQHLEAKVESGFFRKDLYYRLKAHHIEIPALRDRREDIPLLLDHFLAAAASSLDKQKPTLPPEIFDLLGTYHFPGNVRELRAMIYDAVSQHRAGVLALRRFDKAIGGQRPVTKDTREAAAVSAELLTFSARLPTLKQAADLVVKEALRRANGNQTQAARLLGITRPALAKRLQK